MTMKMPDGLPLDVAIEAKIKSMGDRRTKCGKYCGLPHCTVCGEPMECITEESSDYHRTFRSQCGHLPSLRIGVG